MINSIKVLPYVYRVCVYETYIQQKLFQMKRNTWKILTDSG